MNLTDVVSRYQNCFTLPTIYSVIQNGGGSYYIRGTQINFVGGCWNWKMCYLRSVSSTTTAWNSLGIQCFSHIVTFM